jgi:hypothetical protein
MVHKKVIIIQTMHARPPEFKFIKKWISDLMGENQFLSKELWDSI